MNLKKTLYDLVENNATVKGKYFDYFIQLLIILQLLQIQQLEIQILIIQLLQIQLLII